MCQFMLALVVYIVKTDYELDTDFLKRDVRMSEIKLEGKYSLESTDPRENEFAPTCVRNSLLSHLS